MKENVKKFLPILGLIVAAALGGAALWAGEAIPAGLSGLMFGLSGMLIGLAGTAFLMDRAQRSLAPEERKEIERAETDERNVSIREKAACASWYWTLYLLWGVFFLALVCRGGMYVALISVVIVLHCVFLMINMSRWAKKM